jgi:hypothetical protein
VTFLLALVAAAALAVCLREVARTAGIASAIADTTAVDVVSHDEPYPGSFLSPQLTTLARWARRDNVPLLMMVLEIRAPKIQVCARTLREKMRRHEGLYDLGAGRYVALLWNCPESDVLLATRRFAHMLERIDLWSLEIGAALLDVDATSPADLLDAAHASRINAWELFDDELSEWLVDPELRAPLSLRSRVELFFATEGPILALGTLVGFALLRLSEFFSVPDTDLEQHLFGIASGVGFVLLGKLYARLGGLPALLSAGLAIGTWYLSQPIDAYHARTLLRAASASIVGYWASKIADRKDLLAPVVLLASCGDIWSVYSEHGVTGRFSKNQDLVEAVALPGLTPDGVPVFLLGYVDIAFIALMITWSVTWNLPKTRTVVGLALGLSALFVADVVMPLGTVIPAIPFLSVGFLMMHPGLLAETWRSMRSRSDNGSVAPRQAATLPAVDWP